MEVTIPSSTPVHEPSLKSAEHIEYIRKLEQENEQLLTNVLQEKKISAENLDKKNKQINIMRIKLNRYEFAIKEGVLFLAKPMDMYDGRPYPRQL